MEPRLEVTANRVIELWKKGFTIKQISKEYMRDRKRKGFKITLLEAQAYVEPIIFDYQVDLMKNKGRS